MKVKVDTNVNGETSALQDATLKAPVQATIVKTELIAAEDLPEQFEDRTRDRYQLTVMLDGDELTWMPNKTALKTIVAAYGDESDNWAGKSVGMYLLDQNVAGKMKKVAYAVITATAAA